MTDNTIPANGSVRVWVCPVTALDASGKVTTDPNAVVAYGMPFSGAAAWQLFPGLIPQSSTETASSRGSCSFGLLRATRTETSDNQAFFYPGIVLGMYVAIDTSGATGSLLLSNAEWVGYLTNWDTQIVAGTSELVGTVTAMEIGDLLDRQQVRGWSKLQGGVGIHMDNPPTANLGDTAGQIIGNCILSNGNWLFTSTPTDFGYAYPNTSGSGVYTGDIGKYWTRWRLLSHITKYCRTTAMPTINVACQDGSNGVDPTDITTIAGYLNQTSLPEIYDLRELTWAGMLDILIPRDRNLGWRLSVDDGSQGGAFWSIFIYSLADDTDYGVPANTNQVAIDATANPYVTMRVVQDCSDLPDKVVIEGGPCVFAGTIGIPDGNLAIGWNVNSQAAFFSAASALTGYSSLPYGYQIEQNRLYRTQGWLRDVFVRFTVNPESNGDVRLATNPGQGDGTQNSSAFPLCPRIAWDTDTKALTFDGTSATPYLGSTAILRTIPVPYGYKSDGTDQRTQWQKIQPQYMPMRAFLHDATLSLGFQWKDLAVPSPLSGNARASISPDDRGAAVRVEFSPPELFARGIWPTDGSAAASDIDPNGVGLNPNTLVVTLAVESDQKVRVERIRPGLGSDDTYVMRPLIIKIPRLQCMGIWRGTIIGLAGGTGVDQPDSWSAIHTKLNPAQADSAGVFWFRNDWALCDLYCSQAANWAFRPRRSVTMTQLVATDTPDHAVIGCMVTEINESADVSVTVGTVVESITRTYGTSPRLTVTTSLPRPPSFTGATIVHSSPTGGGQVSNALGGTMAQAIKGVRDAVHHLERKTQRPSLITAMPYTAPGPSWVQIVGGQVVNTVPMIQYSADPFSADKSYNPLTDTSYIAGLGYGMLYSANTGQQMGLVIVRHNFLGFTDPLQVGGAFQVCAPIQVPVTGGGSITAYPVVGLV